LQERTAGAVWAIAGDNIEERLIMAERISVRLLVDFVSSTSPLLNLIGAEGLYALAAGPIGQHDNINFAGGVQALIYLIRRPPPDCVPVIAGRPVRHGYCYSFDDKYLLLISINTMHYRQKQTD